MGVPELLAGAAAGMLGVGALGVFHPRVALFGPELSRVRTLEPQVALTFDDGPHPDFTPRIAEVLARYQVQATFFCVGGELERHGDVARTLHRAGHGLANHTYGHSTGAELFQARRLTADLARCQKLLLDLTGETCRHYRPAVGIRNPEVHRAARALGLTVVTWSLGARDGLFALTHARARSLARRAKPGSILALHDGVRGDRTALREATVRHLPALLEALQARGLRVGTLEALLQPRRSSASTVPSGSRTNGFLSSST